MAADESKLDREQITPYLPPVLEQLKKQDAPRKLESVVKGKVKIAKPSFFKKIFSSVVTGNEERDVKDYIIYDVVLPAFKSMIADSIKTGIDMLLYGERRNPAVTRNGMRSYVSYNSYYTGNDQTTVQNRGPQPNKYNFDEIIFSSRGEAEEVLTRLSETVDEYHLASVADLYDLCGIHTQFTDNKWGWTSLKEAYTERVRDGYIIHLPRAKPLN